MIKKPKHIYIFSHAAFWEIRSIQRYADWIASGLEKMGYQVSIEQPSSLCYAFLTNFRLEKYGGYLDSFLLFPFKIRKLVRKNKKDCLFVLADQALGPWAKYFPLDKLVIHCHDFLAQFSAEGVHSLNPVSKSGVLYQHFIRKGYIQGKNFICISQKTKADLLKFLPCAPINIEVIYNGVNPVFYPLEKRPVVRSNFPEKFILHVGGNQWYKNRKGVIISFFKYKSLKKDDTVVLILVGEPLSSALQTLIQSSDYAASVICLPNIDDSLLRLLYNQSLLLLFPSIAEGFGWPIAEAMACGTLVITTKEMPMTEVGGPAAYYVRRMPENEALIDSWAGSVAVEMEKAFMLSENERSDRVEEGFKQVALFKSQKAIERIEQFYVRIFNSKNN